MTERELRKLEGAIKMKMEAIKKQQVTLKDSGIGALMNSLKKVDEAAYEKILPAYKKMVAEYHIFK
jgi:SAM-dependent MidA family methyltransferase